MATYPTPPGPRIAWDDPDFGAPLVIINREQTQILGQATQSEKENANSNETVSVDHGSHLSFVILLPEPYDIVGLNLSQDDIGGSEYSTDTTTGLDGTWLNAGHNGAGSSQAAIRTGTTTVDLEDVVGIRTTAGGNNGRLYRMHLYGSQSTPHGLKLWDPSTDVALDHSAFDTEDTVDTDANDVTFRVKNLDGASKTNVTLTMEERGPNTGFDDMHQIDTGSGFGSFPANIGTLNSGQISSVITVRQTIDDTQLGLAWARLKVGAD